MKVSVTDLLFGFSTALDAVEGEIIGATTYHSQRVAYMCTLMGKAMGLSDNECLNLAAAAVLHDNALTEYVQGEEFRGISKGNINIEKALGRHCYLGEENVKNLPIHEYITDAILYHHERADGEGPFRKKPHEIPLFARLIHIADRVDVMLDFSHIDEAKYNRVIDHIKKSTGNIYDEEMADAFLKSVSYEHLKGIEGNKIVSILYEALPERIKDYTPEELLSLSDMFARIIDFKSPFTTRHSKGIAEKAKLMGEYYGWDSEICNQLFFAGAVHDVGKLFVDNDLLEKPGKLTELEFKKIQDHATGTYVVLHSISGLGAITDWASLHHEKLDGSGYPFGKTGDELDKKERLMACIDIYQALVEPRPYKDGMPHEKALEILRDMVSQGKIDKDIVEDIDKAFTGWIEPKA